jgi:hypothetical protein
MLELSGITALLITAVYRLTEEDEPLYFIRTALDRLLLNKYYEARTIYYPILYCVYCMSSLWGVAVYMAANGVQLTLPYLGGLVLHVLLTYGLVWFINTKRAY